MFIKREENDPPAAVQLPRPRIFFARTRRNINISKLLETRSGETRRETKIISQMPLNRQHMCSNSFSPWRRFRHSLIDALRNDFEGEEETLNSRAVREMENQITHFSSLGRSEFFYEEIPWEPACDVRGAGFYIKISFAVLWLSTNWVNRRYCQELWNILVF